MHNTKLSVKKRRWLKPAYRYSLFIAGYVAKLQRALCATHEHEVDRFVLNYSLLSARSMS